MNKFDIFQLEFIKKLSELDFVAEIWLFGSRARGDFHDRSDIDIAIICPTATNENWSQVMAIVDESDILLKIDCVRFDLLEENDLFRKNILNQKIVLYTQNLPWFDSFVALGQAIDRLEEAVNHPSFLDDRMIRDATIQRFEFVTELFWKILKKILMHDKVEATSPRDTLSKAYQYKLIDHQEQWLIMLDDRNMTSHVYRQSMADLVLARIPTYLTVFKVTYKKLEESFIHTED